MYSLYISFNTVPMKLTDMIRLGNGHSDVEFLRSPAGLYPICQSLISNKLLAFFVPTFTNVYTAKITFEVTVSSMRTVRAIHEDLLRNV